MRASQRGRPERCASTASTTSAAGAEAKRQAFAAKGHSRNRSSNQFLNLLLGDPDRHVLEKGAHEHRLLDRGPADVQHGQRRRANVARINRPVRLLLSDVFHLILEVPTRRFLMMFWMVYVLCFLLFACIYRLSSERCGMDCRSFKDALFLSIETMMTIGYGVPDPFFKSCPWFSVVIITQCLLAVTLDGSLVGIVYQRISTGGRRSSTILFSAKAVIRNIGDSVYLMFQVCEMRSSQLLECHVRLYCFIRPQMDSQASIEIGRNVDIEMVQMRLDQPDDTLGATMLLVLPNIVAHRIDEWSPLFGYNSPDNGFTECADCTLSKPSSTCHMQRASDADGGGRYSWWCEVCGECYFCMEQLRLHVQYSAAHENYEHGHKDLLQRLPAKPSVDQIRRNIQEFMSTRYIEVICILEGVDPVTSSTVQARHSYISEDIVWDHDFQSCVSDAVQEHGRVGIQIDFSNFHGLVPCESPDVPRDDEQTF